MNFFGKLTVERRERLMSTTKGKIVGIVFMISFIVPWLYSSSRGDSHREKEILEKLKKGKIIAQIRRLPGSNTYKCKAMGIVYAPRDVLWKILSDYNNFKYFMPNIKESFIVHPEGLEAFPEIKNSQIKDWPKFEKELIEFKQENVQGDTLYFYNRFNLPWPLKDRYYILKMIRKPEDYAFYWTLYAGNTKVNKGSWELMPFKGSRRKTLAVYTLLTDPGVSVSPGLMRIAIKIALPGTIKAVRKRALRLILEERKNARS